MTAYDAVVVGTVAVGESSRIVRLLSAERGRHAAVAAGARRSKKRFAGLLDPGTRVRVSLQAGRGELPTITTIDLVAAPRRAREAIERIAALAYGCELCAALAPEDHDAPKLHALLVAWLDLLEGDATPGAASRVALEGKALTFAGLAPRLDRCSRCGLPLADPAVFDATAGGGQHARCGGGAPIAVAALAELEALRRTPLADTPTRPAPAARWLLADFVRHQLGRALRSRGLVADVES